MLRKHILTIGITFIAIIIKLWIFSTLSVGIDARSFHDGLLHVTLAGSILDGRWLGDFNNLTLAKGSFYPLFIAFSHKIGIPLITSQQLLFTIACIMAALVAYKIAHTWKHRIFCITFLLLLFSPYAFDAYINLHINRTAIYHSLSLLTLSCFFLSSIELTKKRLHHAYLFALFGGMCLACAWMTREESVWLLIPSFFLYGYTLIHATKKKQVHHAISNGIIAAIAFFICLSPILLLNKLYYGTFILTEYQHPAFVEAYGALTRVQPDTFIPYVPVSKATRIKIAAVSPTFATLQPYLEGDIGNNWATTTKENAPLANNEFDIGGGWFMWALRDATQEAGKYATLNDALTFYKQMTKEINDACEAKTLRCTQKRNTFMPPWNNEYIPYIKHYAAGLYNELFFMNHIYFKFAEWEDPKTNYEFMQNVTLEHPHVFIDTDPSVQIIKKITALYKLLLFPSFIISIGLFAIALIQQKKKLLQSAEFMLSISLFLGILSLFTILVLLAGMSYPLAIISGYFAPLPPLIILLTVILLVTYCNFSVKRKS